MSIGTSRVALHSLCLLASIALLAGCGGGASEKSYHPNVDVARNAVTAALDAWKGGQAKPGKIESSKPAVQVSDPAWESGTKLTSYEIVQAHEGSDPRKFTVKLTLEGQPAPVEIIYVVVGKDPLHVWREEEYNRNSTM